MASLGARAVDLQYLAAQRVFPDKAFPYVLCKSSSPPWPTGGNGNASGGTASPRGARTSSQGCPSPSSGGVGAPGYGGFGPGGAAPLYSAGGLGLGLGGGALARPFSAAAVLHAGVGGAGGGVLGGRGASSAGAPREAWRAGDFRVAAPAEKHGLQQGEVEMPEGAQGGAQGQVRSRGEMG